MTELDARAVRRLTDMHAVYRMFDDRGRLLYVGVTGNPSRRIKEHSEKRWFPLVTSIRLEWFQTRAAAVLAESRAIQAERPRLNITVPPTAGEEPPEARSVVAVREVIGRQVAARAVLREEQGRPPGMITATEAWRDEGLYPSSEAARKALQRAVKRGAIEPAGKDGSAHLFRMSDIARLKEKK